MLQKVSLIAMGAGGDMEGGLGAGWARECGCFWGGQGWSVEWMGDEGWRILVDGVARWGYWGLMDGVIGTHGINYHDRLEPVRVMAMIELMN